MLINFVKNRKDYIKKIKLGKEKMKTHNVAICSIVRDCEINLKNNIKVINKLRSFFKTSHIIIVENDSKDGTKFLLNEWAKNDESIIIKSENLNIQTMPNNNSQNKWFSKYRIKNMADYRNKYLNILESKRWSIDYVIIIDLDLKEICLNGIANSFGQEIEWDIITSNGRNYVGKEYVYWDTYAFKAHKSSYIKHFSEITHIQQKNKNLKKGMPLIKIDSGFNGLAIYKNDILKDVYYKCVDNNSSEIEAICEHVTFHEDIRNKGYSNFFINPSQIVYYNKKASLYKRGFNYLVNKVKLQF